MLQQETRLALADASLGDEAGSDDTADGEALCGLSLVSFADLPVEGERHLGGDIAVDGIGKSFFDAAASVSTGDNKLTCATGR